MTTTSPAGSTTAPSGAAATTRDHALVRVVHAIPAGAAIDVYAGHLVMFDALAYKAVTPYRELDGDRHSFNIKPAGMDKAAALASNSEALSDGQYYTVFALPGDGTAAYLRVVDDDHDEPADGRARIRVVHAAADVGELDLSIAGREEPVLGGIDFQSVTDFKDVDPGIAGLELRMNGSRTSVLTLPDERLDAGKSYTVVVVGRRLSKPSLEAFVVRDEPAATSSR